MKVLDIGAGNTIFAKKLRNLNPQVTTVICGDIKFQKGEYDLSNGILTNIGIFCSRFSKILSKEELEQVIENTRKGIFKVFADYRNVPLEDESMDMVTLNSPHPFFPVRIEGFEEIKRVLKKGGIFYFGHSIEIYTPYKKDEMQLIGEGEFRYKGEKLGKIDAKKLVFPMSPIISQSAIGYYLESKGQKLHSYGRTYDSNHPCKIPLNPNWKAWEKV